MSTFATIKARIADELARSDLTSNISAAVLSAIVHYSKESFYFLENRATASTVSGTRNIAYQTGHRWTDNLKITVASNDIRTLSKITWAEMEGIYSGTTPTGVPHVWADYQNNIWLYPIPNGVYTLTDSAPVSLTALSADADTNAWMVEAEELIRCRAKWDIYFHVIMDDNGAKKMKQAEGEALQKLRGLNVQRVSAGRVASYL